jgi:hypothetical protein
MIAPFAEESIADNGFESSSLPPTILEIWNGILHETSLPRTLVKKNGASTKSCC